MMKMKTYSEIENDLFDRIEDVIRDGDDFVLNIGNKDGKLVDTIFIGIRHIFVYDWIVIGNDASKDSKSFILINSEDVNKDKEKIGKFISEFGYQKDNYYTFEEIS